LDKGSPREVNGIVIMHQEFEELKSPTGCWDDFIKTVIRTRFESERI
jgi:hypothetical protein